MKSLKYLNPWDERNEARPLNRNFISLLNLALSKKPEHDDKDDDHRYKTAAKFIRNTARDQASL